MSFRQSLLFIQSQQLEDAGFSAKHKINQRVNRVRWCRDYQSNWINSENNHLNDNELQKHDKNSI